MSIYKKTPKGVFYYDLCVDGKRLRGSCKTNNKQEAELVEQTMRFAVRPNSTKEKVIKLIDLFFEDEAKPDIPINLVASEATRLSKLAGKEVGRITLCKRNQACRRLEKWLEAKWKPISGVRAIDRSCAMAFAEQLANEGLSAKTRWNVLSILGGCWNLLARGYDDINNPWKLVAPISHESENGNAFTYEEVQRIFAIADDFGHEWGLACRIAASTGLRYGDVANLKAEHIVDGCIRTMPSKTKAHKIQVCIPLPREIVAMLPTHTTGYIMPEQERIYRLHYREAPFSDILKLAKIDPNKYTFHSFRHYFRTQLSRAGVPSEVAMKLGGWTQSKTADRYDHHDHLQVLSEAVQNAWNKK